MNRSVKTHKRSLHKLTKIIKKNKNKTKQINQWYSLTASQTRSNIDSQSATVTRFDGIIFSSLVKSTTSTLLRVEKHPIATLATSLIKAC